MYDSWEHMDHDEHMAWFLRPIRVSRWIRLKVNLKDKLNHWRAMRHLQYEIDHEDPKGGIEEVLRLRPTVVIDSIQKDVRR